MSESVQLTPIQQFYKGKTIFITGGSGFMGKVSICKKKNTQIPFSEYDFEPALDSTITSIIEFLHCFFLLFLYYCCYNYSHILNIKCFALFICFYFCFKVLIEKLLYSCSELKEILILIRPKKGKSPESRLDDMFKIPVSNI